MMPTVEVGRQVERRHVLETALFVAACFTASFAFRYPDGDPDPQTRSTSRSRSGRRPRERSNTSRRPRETCRGCGSTKATHRHFCTPAQLIAMRRDRSRPRSLAIAAAWLVLGAAAIE